MVSRHRGRDDRNGFLLSVSRLHARNRSRNYIATVPGAGNFRALFQATRRRMALDLHLKRRDLFVFQSLRPGRAIVREDSGSACARTDPNRVSIQTYPAHRAHDFRFALHCRTDSISSGARTCHLRPQPDFIHEFVQGKSERTLLLLHGTGGNERDLIPLGHELDRTASLLSPRGKVLENGMPRFFRRLAEGVFDLEDLQKRTHELADFVVSAGAHYKIDNRKIIAVGYSNGANIAASILLLRPEILSAAVLFRAMVPLVPKTTPSLNSKRVWIGAGAHDPIIPASNTKELVEMLRIAGADLTIRFFQSGHQLTSDDVDLAREWLTKSVD